MATIKTSSGRKRLSAPKKTTKVKTKIIFRDREGGDIKTEPLTATENKTYTAPEGKAYTPVTVNVSGGSPVINLQEKTVTENGTVTPDSGYDGLSKVTVNVSGGSGGITKLYYYGEPSFHWYLSRETDVIENGDLVIRTPSSTGFTVTDVFCMKAPGEAGLSWLNSKFQNATRNSSRDINLV